MGIQLNSIVSLSLPLMLTLAIFGCKKPNHDEEQIREGYRMSQEAPEVPLEHKTRRFEFKGNSFELLPPAGFTLKELMSPVGKMFQFLGPKNSGGHGAVVTITVSVPALGEPPTPPLQVIKSMLSPFEQHFANYARIEKPPFKINGLTFEGASFSGLAGGTSPAKGSVLITTKNNVIYIVFYLCPESDIGPFQSQFEDMLKSFKVLG